MAGKTEKERWTEHLPIPVQCMKCQRGLGIKDKNFYRNFDRDNGYCPWEWDKATMKKNGNKKRCPKFLKGPYAAYSYGGYDIVYFDEYNNVLCADCASEEDQYDGDIIGYMVTDMSEEPIYCDDCGKVIDPYGDD